MGDSRIIRNTIYLYIRLAVSTIISLLIVRLILKSLGQVDYGIYSIISGLVALFRIVDGTLVTSTTRFIIYAEGKNNDAKKNRVFNIAMRLHLGLASIVAIIMEIAFILFWDRMLNIPEDHMFAAKVVYQFMVVSSFLTTLTNPYEALIVSHEDLGFLAIWGITQSVAKLAMSIGLFYITSNKLIIYGLGMLLIYIGAACSRYIYCGKYKERKISFSHFGLSDYLMITNFTGWIAIGTITNAILISGCNLLQNSFFGVLVNAAEGIATQVSGQMTIFATTIMQAVTPVIIKSESGSDRLQSFVLTIRSSKIIGYVFIMMIIPFILKADYILKIWIHDIPEHAVAFCQFAVAKSYFNAISYPFFTFLNAIGNIKRYQISESIMNISSLIVAYFLLFLGGFPEVIYILLMGYEFFRMVLRVIELKRLYSFKLSDFFISNLGTNIAVGLTTAAIIFYVTKLIRVDSIKLIVACLASFSLISAYVYFFELTESEKRMLKQKIEQIANLQQRTQ